MPWENSVDCRSILPKIGGCSAAVQGLDSMVFVGPLQVRIFCGFVTTEWGEQDIKKHLPFQIYHWQVEAGEARGAQRDCDEMRNLGLALKQLFTLSTCVILMCKEGLYSFYP